MNDRPADHFQKHGLFSDFQYGFRSSRSTADLLTLVSERIGKAFDQCGTFRAATCILKLALFHLFSVIDGFGWFWIGRLMKSIQLMMEFLKALFLVLHFSCNTLMTILMMLSVILLVILMILHSTPSVIGIWFVATTNLGF